MVTIENQQRNEGESKGYKLFEFAYLGDLEKDVFYKKIEYLGSKLVEKSEKWTYSNNRKFDVLHNYILNIFNECYEDGEIKYSSNKQYASSDTGLLDEYGEDIYMLFEKNSFEGRQPWVFKEFVRPGDRVISNHFSEQPNYPSFFKNREDLFFDATLPVDYNSDHMFKSRWSRFEDIVGETSVFNSMGKQDFIEFFKTQVRTSLKRVVRNQRLAVPMYHESRIKYLLPVRIENINVPLAVEVIDVDESRKIRCNTILTKDMAYKNARLIMKPESNWLLG